MEGKRDLFCNCMLATDPASTQSQIALVRAAKLSDKALAMCKVTSQTKGSGGGRRLPFC